MDWRASVVVRYAVAALFAVAVGVAAFLAASQLRSGGQARADKDVAYGPTPPAGPQTPFWYEEIQRERATKPRLDVVINGIEVGPGVSRSGGPCEGLAGDSPERLTRPYSSAAAGPLSIEPKFLPPGSVPDREREVVVYCRGQLALATRDFSVPADREIPRYGGWIVIVRFVGDKRANLNLPEEDFSPGEIAQRPAVLVKPATADGFGESAILIAEPFGLTILHGMGISLSELQKVAESLY